MLQIKPETYPMDLTHLNSLSPSISFFWGQFVFSKNVNEKETVETRCCCFSFMLHGLPGRPTSPQGCSHTWCVCVCLCMIFHHIRVCCFSSKWMWTGNVLWNRWACVTSLLSLPMSWSPRSVNRHLVFSIFWLSLMDWITLEDRYNSF